METNETEVAFKDAGGLLAYLEEANVFDPPTVLRVRRETEQAGTNTVATVALGSCSTSWCVYGTLSDRSASSRCAICKASRLGPYPQCSACGT